MCKYLKRVVVLLNEIGDLTPDGYEEYQCDLEREVIGSLAKCQKTPRNGPCWQDIPVLAELHVRSDFSPERRSSTIPLGSSRTRKIRERVRSCHDARDSPPTKVAYPWKTHSNGGVSNQK